MVYKNRAKLNVSDSDDKTLPFELDFLKEKSTISKEDIHFKKSRIGDETDFLVNLLEKCANLNEKCRLNIEKSVEDINYLTNRTPVLNQASSSFENINLTVDNDDESKSRTSQGPTVSSLSLDNKIASPKITEDELK